MPTKLDVQNPPKTCLERNPRRVPSKKKITTLKISTQMSGLAVIFWFCTLLAGTQDIITSRGEHRGPNLIFMSLKHPPLLPASRYSITSLNSGSKWAKNDKIPKIRYKSVITQKSVIKFS